MVSQGVDRPGDRKAWHLKGVGLRGVSCVGDTGPVRQRKLDSGMGALLGQAGGPWWPQSPAPPTPVIWTEQTGVRCWEGRLHLVALGDGTGSGQVPLLPVHVVAPSLVSTAGSQEF